MRVAIVTSSYAVSSKDTVNAGVFVRQLADELAKLDNEVYLITPKKTGIPEPLPGVCEHYFPWWGQRKDLASAQINNPFILASYLTLILSGIWHVFTLARSKKIQAMLAMWTIPSGIFCWLSWKLLGIPYGVWALGSDIWARNKYPFGNQIVVRILKDAEFCFADGMGLSKEVRLISGRKCEFVPSIRRLPPHKQAYPIRSKESASQFLFIGRYENNKGPDLLIQAMKKVIDRGHLVQLQMFGNGSMDEKLKTLIGDYREYIHLNGYADPDTVTNWMSSSDWLVIPSRVESIPLVFFDAIQMHLPVIVSNVGDLGELVELYQVGLTFSAGDVDLLAEKILTATETPKFADPINWEAIQKQFDLSQSVRICNEYLARTCGGSCEIPA